MEPVIKDVVAEAKGRLFQQFKDKPKINALLDGIMNQIQESEDSKFDLLNGVSIYAAIGERLDVCGSIVGELRLGKTDEEYRAAILQKIAINTSNGTPDKLLQILQILTAAPDIKLWEHYPANLIFYANNVDGDMDSVRATLQNAAPAAVGNVGVIHDPTSLGFAPAETLYSDVTLEAIVTNLDENIVDQDGEFIVAQTAAVGDQIGSLAEGDSTFGGLLVEYYG